MDLELLFWIAHLPALVGWALLALPGRDGRRIRAARTLGAVLALAYLLLFLASGTAGAVLLRDYSLAGLGAFFADPLLRLVGWVHYLAFDLWVGSWEAEEADRLGIGPAVLLPSLLLTFMLGPIGLLLFLALSHRWRKARAVADGVAETPG